MNIPDPATHVASDLVFESFLPLYLGGKREILEIGMRSTIPKFAPEVIISLCQETQALLKSQPSIVYRSGPIHIIGDLHGNLHDLLRICQTAFQSGEMNMLFLGDYVDRGDYSTEVILLLFSLFCKYPDKITLLRGNHEFNNGKMALGLSTELTSEYEDRAEFVVQAVHEVFNWLPLAAVVGSSLFCVHGGISKEVVLAGDIGSIPYPVRNYDSPMVADLLWSDPMKSIARYTESERGVGHYFGPRAVSDFLEANGFRYIIRAHEVVDEGIDWPFEGVITVFSTSGYHNGDNRAGYLIVDEQNTIHQRYLNPIKFVKRNYATFNSVALRPPREWNKMASLKGELPTSFVGTRNRSNSGKSQQLSSPPLIPRDPAAVPQRRSSFKKTVAPLILNRKVSSTRNHLPRMPLG